MIEESNKYFFICNINELPEGKGKRFYVNECEIAVFKINGEISVLSNICPHQKSAIIYDGIIEDEKIICPAHGWEFNIKTGCYLDGRHGLDSYEKKIENGKLFAKVFRKELKW